MTAYVSLTLNDLRRIPPAEILESLLRSDAVSGFTQASHEQIRAWREQIVVLQHLATQGPTNLDNVGVALEYRIPRREKRIDLILLLRTTIVVVEFKGATASRLEGLQQVSDYALDLTYYHQASRSCEIIPLVCRMGDSERSVLEERHNESKIGEVLGVGSRNLRQFLVELESKESKDLPFIDHNSWCSSPYLPIPGVIEATISLFDKHRVSDITKSLTNKKDIQKTVSTVLRVIQRARDRKEKILILLTGVPGAGKTLVGLQIVHDSMTLASGWNSVFLSGNGPLLKVLIEALARDYHQRQQTTLVAARRHANTLLHSVHSFLHEATPRDSAPTEQLIVFDEAQRAWDSEKMKKMARRQRRMSGVDDGQPGVLHSMSEPYQIINLLDRHEESGAVLVALCGTGQEIHDGEAGTDEWINTCVKYFPNWSIITGANTVKGMNIEITSNVCLVDDMHLTEPVRAHRAKDHAKWVDAVLEGRATEAKKFIDQDEFSIVLTRSVNAARQWLKESARGSRRVGLLASSSASRLRPYGLEVSGDFRKGIDYPKWFTTPKGDLNSSFALEVAATEFECQGLELDRVCIAWCWDLLLSEQGVQPRSIRGDTWRLVTNDRKQQYGINKYRVLLTRAREGMVLFCPRGERDDPTRSPEEMNLVVEFLLKCGVQDLD